jgi:tetratricopeptide (TPR) repeat protein
MNLHSQSRILLDTLNQKFPNDIEILYLYASVYYNNKEWTKLLSIYSDIYKLNTEQDIIILKIYEIGVSTDQIDLVKTILLDLKSFFESKVTLNLLIEISQLQGDIEGSINYIEEYIERYEVTNDLGIKLGLLYLRLNEYQKVVNIIRPLYNTGNKSIELLRIYLIAHSGLKNFEDELRISKEIMQIYPDFQLGYEALSIAFLNLGDISASIDILLIAIKKFPSEIKFYFSLGTIFYSMSDLLNSEKYFVKVLEINPNYVPAKHNLAMIYESRDNTYLSDSLFINIIEGNNNNYIWKNDYAYILSERDELSVDKLNFALQLAEMAVETEPDNAAFLDTIGWINYRLGFYDEAKYYLEKSLNINDKNPVILEHMADIYAKINRHSDALNLYKKILKIDSENIKIKNKINQLYEK